MVRLAGLLSSCDIGKAKSDGLFLGTTVQSRNQREFLEKAAVARRKTRHGSVPSIDAPSARLFLDRVASPQSPSPLHLARPRYARSNGKIKSAGRFRLLSFIPNCGMCRHVLEEVLSSPLRVEA